MSNDRYSARPVITTSGAVFTKEDIVALLDTNDYAVCRAVLALHDRQTQVEQAHDATIYRNGWGVTPADAKMFARAADYIRRNGTLNPNFIRDFRKVERSNGATRIGKYALQLLAIARETQMKARMENAKVDMIFGRRAA